MNMAKSISLLVTQKGDLKEFIKGKLPLKRREVLSTMIPTTAGT